MKFISDKSPQNNNKERNTHTHTHTHTHVIVLCNIVCNNCAQCRAHTYEQT